MISVIALLQHDSEPSCIMQGLLTALDALAPLNLPCVMAHCGAVDTPAVVDSIRHFTQQFTLLQEIVCTFLMMQGDPADPLTAVRSIRDSVMWIIMLYNHNRGLWGITAGHNSKSP